MCPYCNTEWKHFDVDSQGGQGFTCSCPKYIWISWPGILKKENENASR